MIAILVVMMALYGWRHLDREAARSDLNTANMDLDQARILLDQLTTESAEMTNVRETIGPTGLNLVSPGPARILSTLRDRLGTVQIKRCVYTPASGDEAAGITLVVVGLSQSRIVGALARLGEKPFSDPVIVALRENAGMTEAEIKLAVKS